MKAKNILLFAPLTINSLVDEWEKDPMGMAGGFMSQSIVTVSYTHLDVYKRQLLPCASRPPSHSDPYLYLS